MRGIRLLRRRGELLERPCAHLDESGGLRRAHVRGHTNLLKRLLIHTSAFNIGLWMRRLFGIGTPRALQGRAVTLSAVLSLIWTLIYEEISPIWISVTSLCRSGDWGSLWMHVREEATCTMMVWTPPGSNEA